MKLIAERDYLAAALAATGRAVSSRNTLPILSNVLLETGDDRLKLTATDLDTAIRCVIPADIAESGSVAIPAAVFNDVISKLPDAPVSLELADNRVRVRCGKSDYKVLYLPGEDYLFVPEVTEGAELTLPQAALKEMLRLTTFAASNDETRSTLRGVLFEARGNTLTLVATDTYRLAWKQSQLGQGIDAYASAIIPAKPLSELGRLLKDTTEDVVRVHFGEAQVQFETADTTLVSRLLDGQFPNYEKVLRRDTKYKVMLDREEFLDAVRRVHIVAKSGIGYPKMVLTIKDDLVELTAESSEVGNAFEEVPAALEGEGFGFAIQSPYVLDVLGALTSEQVTMELGESLNPVFLNPVGDDSYRHVIFAMAL